MVKAMVQPTNVSARAPPETVERLEAHADRLDVKKSHLIRLSLASTVNTLDCDGYDELLKTAEQAQEQDDNEPVQEPEAAD